MIKIKVYCNAPSLIKIALPAVLKAMDNDDSEVALNGLVSLVEADIQ